MYLCEAYSVKILKHVILVIQHQLEYLQHSVELFVLQLNLIFICNSPLSLFLEFVKCFYTVSCNIITIKIIIIIICSLVVLCYYENNYYYYCCWCWPVLRIFPLIISAFFLCTDASVSVCVYVFRVTPKHSLGRNDCARVALVCIRLGYTTFHTECMHCNILWNAFISMQM